jgi:uncharacterized membrane protein YkvA (DUF1232 family)
MPSRLSNSEALHQPSFWKLLWHLPKFIRLIGRLFKDSRVPFAGKLVFILSIVYFISPIDLIPDFLFPIIGEIDDVAILLLGARYLLKQTPPNVLEEHLAQIG